MQKQEVANGNLDFQFIKEEEMQYYNLKFLRMKIKKLVQLSNQKHNIKGIRLQAKVDNWIDDNIDALYSEMCQKLRNSLKNK